MGLGHWNSWIHSFIWGQDVASGGLQWVKADMVGFGIIGGEEQSF
jgi:hypothetical protein